MKIKITGKNMKVGSALKEYTETTLEGAVSKYFDRAIVADVVFCKEAHLFSADIIVNEGTGTGIIIRGQGQEPDVYAAFDAAAVRMEKQLRRYKRKLKNHHKLSTREAALAATKRVLSNEGQEITEGDDKHLIIAEKETHIETLTVSDAVMLMDLANLPALMFVNKKTGKIDLVYHRADGNISWVESDIAASGAKIAPKAKKKAA